MKKHLFIGDLHGNVFRFRIARDYAKKHDMILVCVGDYVDSHNFTRKAQRLLL